MDCPRCGAQVEQGDRFCASCGEDLRGAAAASGARPSRRERAAALIGTTRRARLVTAGTALAIAIAIVAFVALDTADDDIPRDRYTIAADRICVEAKREIVAAGARTLGGERGAYAGRLVPIVAGWRSELNALDPPADRADRVQALEAALREVEVESGALARLAREGSREEVVAKAGQVDELTATVEEHIASLNLDRCARVALGPQAAEPE